MDQIKTNAGHLPISCRITLLVATLLLVAGCAPRQKVAPEPHVDPLKLERQLAEEMSVRAASYLGLNPDPAFAPFDGVEPGTRGVRADGYIANYATEPPTLRRILSLAEREQAKSDHRAKKKDLPLSTLKHTATRELERFVGCPLDPEWRSTPKSAFIWDSPAMAGIFQLGLKQYVNGYEVIDGNQAKIMLNSHTGKVIEVIYRADCRTFTGKGVISPSQALSTCQSVDYLRSIRVEPKFDGIVYGFGRENRASSPDRVKERERNRELSLLLRIKYYPWMEHHVIYAYVNAETGEFEGMGEK